MEIRIEKGDITRHPADAIATLINPHGAWAGGVDFALMRLTTEYHQHAKAVLVSEGLKDGQIIVAKKSQPHAGAFNDVIFCVDAVTQPLSVLVSNILQTAHALGYTKISLPAMRCGVMLGQVEKTVQEAAAEIAKAIYAFSDETPDSDMCVTLVIYDEGEHQSFLEGLKLPE